MKNERSKKPTNNVDKLIPKYEQFQPPNCTSEPAEQNRTAEMFDRKGQYLFSLLSDLVTC